MSVVSGNNDFLAVGLQSGALGNSERIQQKFGNYAIKVLENGPAIRVSNLYSSCDGVRTNRTFAVVAYPEHINPAFKTEHEAILSGQSIGIVFRDNGWTLNKRHQYFGKMESSTGDIDSLSVFGDMGESEPAMHIYSLVVTKNNTEIQYAYIAEIHHPDYLDLDDLRVMYGSEFDDKQVPGNTVSGFLKIVKDRYER